MKKKKRNTPGLYFFLPGISKEAARKPKVWMLLETVVMIKKKKLK